MAGTWGGARRGAGRKKLDASSTSLVPIGRPKKPNRLGPDPMIAATDWRADYRQLVAEFEVPILREILTTGTRAEKFQAMAWCRQYLVGGIPKAAETVKQIDQKQDVTALLFQHVIDKKDMEEKLRLAEERARQLEEGRPIDAGSVAGSPAKVPKL